tara:strand:- start:53 stop:511 length:459 start_codon:yes stop_codon:yes gene_type:complete
MINVEVFVDSKNWKKIIRNPKKLIIESIKKFPKKYSFVNKKIYVSLLLTNNKKIKLLNKRFRNKNKPTDILSFPFFDKKNLQVNLKKKEFYLGDIIISHEEFLRKHKSDYKNEFIKIFIHGYLHLLNFDHKLDKDYKIMNTIEKKIFRKIDG